MGAYIPNSPAHPHISCCGGVYYISEERRQQQQQRNDSQLVVGGVFGHKVDSKMGPPPNNRPYILLRCRLFLAATQQLT